MDVSTHMKRCAALLVAKDIQIKTKCWEVVTSENSLRIFYTAKCSLAIKPRKPTSFIQANQKLTYYQKPVCTCLQLCSYSPKIVNSLNVLQQVNEEIKCGQMEQYQAMKRTAVTSKHNVNESEMHFAKVKEARPKATYCMTPFM